jgi:hypothetical protein
MCTPTQKDNGIGDLLTVCRMWTFKLRTEDNGSKRFYVGWVAELPTELVLQQCHLKRRREDSEIQTFYELAKQYSF